MASQDTDLLPENTSGYKLSQPKQTLEQYQNMGKSDERRSWAAGFLSLLDNGCEERSLVT